MKTISPDACNEMLIEESEEFARGFESAMYEVWSRLPPDELIRNGLTCSDLSLLCEFVQSCLASSIFYRNLKHNGK